MNTAKCGHGSAPPTRQTSATIAIISVTTKTLKRRGGGGEEKGRGGHGRAGKGRGGEGRGGEGGGGREGTRAKLGTKLVYYNTFLVFLAK